MGIGSHFGTSFATSGTVTCKATVSPSPSDPLRRLGPRNSSTLALVKTATESSWLADVCPWSTFLLFSALVCLWLFLCLSLSSQHQDLTNYSCWWVPPTLPHMSEWVTNIWITCDHKIQCMCFDIILLKGREQQLLVWHNKMLFFFSTLPSQSSRIHSSVMAEVIPETTENTQGKQTATGRTVNERKRDVKNILLRKAVLSILNVLVCLCVFVCACICVFRAVSVCVWVCVLVQEVRTCLRMKALASKSLNSILGSVIPHCWNASVIHGFVSFS